MLSDNSNLTVPHRRRTSYKFPDHGRFGSPFEHSIVEQQVLIRGYDDANVADGDPPVVAFKLQPEEVIGLARTAYGGV